MTRAYRVSRQNELPCVGQKNSPESVPEATQLGVADLTIRLVAASIRIIDQHRNAGLQRSMKQRFRDLRGRKSTNRLKSRRRQLDITGERYDCLTALEFLVRAGTLTEFLALGWTVTKPLLLTLTP